MQEKKKSLPVALIVICVVLVFLLAAIATPNFLRSRMAANEASRWGVQLRLISEVQAAERKLAKTAEVQMLAEDPASCASEITNLVASLSGEVTNSTTNANEAGRTNRVLLQVRVPADKLDLFLTQLKRDGWRVLTQSTATVDVTTEYVDTDAKLRNLTALEQRYLSLLKQARNVDETLKVTEKLNAARTEIDSTQNQFKLLNQQVATSLVKIIIEPDSDARVLGVYWRPAAKIRHAWRDLLSGLTDFADVAVGFIIRLPLYLIWLFAVLGLIVVCLRIIIRVFQFFAARGWFSGSQHTNSAPSGVKT